MSPAARLPAPEAEADRRIVTVMFCDIVGSTALTASMDPEAFVSVLLAYREVCAAIILRHGGHGDAERRRGKQRRDAETDFAIGAHLGSLQK